MVNVGRYTSPIGSYGYECVLKLGTSESIAVVHNSKTPPVLSVLVA